MNRTKVLACLCSTVFTMLLAGCGGSNSGNASIGGSVTGLATGTTLTLQDNGGDTTVVSVNGNFLLPGSISSGNGYDVTVSAQPTGQNCVVSYGSGVIDYAGDKVSNVAVTCSANAAVSVVANGLSSGQSVTFELTLQNQAPQSASDEITATATVNGAANSFTTPSSSVAETLPPGTVYSVTVLSQSTGLACNVIPPVSGTSSSAYSPASGGIINSAPITVYFNCQNVAN